MKKIISIFMSLVLIAMQSVNTTFAMNSEDLPEDPIAGRDIESFDLARQEFENDIPYNGRCGKETYSDGTVIEYVPGKYAEKAINKYTDKYKAYHSNIAFERGKTKLSSEKKCIHTAAAAGFLAVGGLDGSKMYFLVYPLTLIILSSYIYALIPRQQLFFLVLLLDSFLN